MKGMNCCKRIWIRWLPLVVLVLAVIIPKGAVARVAEYRNPEMVAAARAGEIDEANVLWWGFAPDDSTEYLQAAINSGVSRLIVPLTSGRIGLSARSSFAVTWRSSSKRAWWSLQKKGEFHGRNDSLFTAQDVENLVIRGYGGHPEDAQTGL